MIGQSPMLRDSILAAAGLSLHRQQEVSRAEQPDRPKKEEEDQWDLAQAARYLAGRERAVAVECVGLR
eukprot:737005-Hanusia_phi.AAC.1